MSYGRIPLAQIDHGSTYPAWYFDCLDDADLPYRFGEDASVVAEIRTSLGDLVYRYSTAGGTAAAVGQRVSFAEIDAATTAALRPGTHTFTARVTNADGYARTFLEARKFSIAVRGAN
ncbi:hypothetical protein [Nevskia sp.]|uniref:hypothetical protein n=1 Tax=Nevskia sp. TaxID=1929292 RepID=UPI0025D5DF09|nr:hypothetical protein [Nevskia sp.]